MTDDGDLLASETVVAGVILPRGFSLKFTLDHEWYYDGPKPIARVEKYFRERLDVGGIEHPFPSATLFVRAQTKGASNMEAVGVKIFPVPGRSDWSRIQINAPRPIPTELPTPEQVEAHFRASRENYN